MRINCISNNITFQKLPIKDKYGVKIIDEFVYRAQDANRTMYTVKNDGFINDSYDFFFINDDELEPAASQQVKIDPDLIYVDNMYTNPELQHKYGFGKSMHLLNIIEMLENNAARIDLDASGEAIPFHTSMGFYPDSTWENGLELNIKQIAKNRIPRLEDYAKKAKKVIFEQEYIILDEIINRRANKLLNQYTKAATKILPKPELKYLFSFPIKMTLREQQVTENKDFYNKLFDKYEIDYHID